MNKGRDETPIIIHKIHNHYEAVSYNERHKTLWKDIYKTMEERNISWIDKEHIPVSLEQAKSTIREPHQFVLHSF